MISKFLYLLVAVLVLVMGWQMLSHHRANHYLEVESAAQAYGADAKDAKVIVVAFMDYTCRNCKDSNPFVLQAVVENPDTRIIFHPLPQASEVSQKTARYALAAAQQGQFMAMHEELMRNERPVTDAVLRDIAQKLRLDLGQLESDAASDAVTERLTHTAMLADKLHLQFTPSFIFNRKMLYSPPRANAAYPDFLQLIKQARS